MGVDEVPGPGAHGNVRSNDVADAAESSLTRRFECMENLAQEDVEKRKAHSLARWWVKDAWKCSSTH